MVNKALRDIQTPESNKDGDVINYKKLTEQQWLKGMFLTWIV